MARHRAPAAAALSRQRAAVGSFDSNKFVSKACGGGEPIQSAVMQCRNLGFAPARASVTEATRSCHW
jgi:hypothetical protein